MRPRARRAQPGAAFSSRHADAERGRQLQQRRTRQQSLADGVDVAAKLRQALRHEVPARQQQLLAISELQSTADLATANCCAPESAARVLRLRLAYHVKTQRLPELLQLLRCHRYPLTAQRIAEQLHISVRTVYRDILSLQQQGVRLRAARALALLKSTAICRR